MKGSRSKILLIISLAFLIMTLLLAMPSMAFAQEEEEAEGEAQEPEPKPATLEFDVSYGEITNLGAKGTVFEFEVAASISSVT